MVRRFRSWLSSVQRGPVSRGFLAEWTVTVIFLLFCWTSLLQAYVIPSGSMESTLLVGDHLFVDRLTFVLADRVSKHLLPYRDVRRGDVIIFRSPVESLTLVKRAIGVPGDHLRLSHKKLILNGKPIDEPYAQHTDPNLDPYRDDFPSAAPPRAMYPRGIEMLQSNVVNGELIVPAGFVFAMGDNRENSNDSRYWGLVPRENIEGTPVVIYWSFDAPTEDLSNPNIGFDHVVDVAIHFFSKTRWRRTFQFVRGYPLGS